MHTGTRKTWLDVEGAARTRARCFAVNLRMSKCHNAQCPTDAHSLSGVPRKNLAMAPFGLLPHSSISSFMIGCHAVSSTSLQQKQR